MKSVVLAVLVMGSSLAFAAPVSTNPSNPKLIALFKKMDSEGHTESQKGAVAVYMTFLESAIESPEESPIVMVKAGRECLKRHSGAKAGEMARRAESAMVPAQMSRAKTLGQRAEREGFDGSNDGVMIFLGACQGI